MKNQISKKVYLPWKPTWRSCFFLFHSHDPKPKQNHQISSRRAKTRSTRNQECGKYRGNIICLQPYSWLENFGHYGSFGTMILGSLIVSPVLWILSSRNTLYVTQSDKASYTYVTNLVWSNIMYFCGVICLKFCFSDQEQVLKGENLDKRIENIAK